MRRNERSGGPNAEDKEKQSDKKRVTMGEKMGEFWGLEREGRVGVKGKGMLRRVGAHDVFLSVLSFLPGPGFFL